MTNNTTNNTTMHTTNNTTIHTSKCSDSDSGYQVADRYTIQPLTTSIDIKTERKLIASWLTSGLTDTQIRKMLILYFGIPEWMNLQKLYDSYRFSEIAKGLKFRSKEDFLEILLKCTGFGRIWKNEKDGHQAKNLKAFYTPIWHLAKEDELENLQDMQKKCILEMHIIIIIIILILIIIRK